MAKKQDISYSPNTSLIGGAAVAYRDYDNMPGMYAGLDKVIKAGSEMIGGAVKDFEEEKKKQEAIEKAWDDSATDDAKTGYCKWYDFTCNREHICDAWVGKKIKKSDAMNLLGVF